MGRTYRGEKSSVGVIIHTETIYSSDKEKSFQVKVVYKDSVATLMLWWPTQPDLGDIGRAIKGQIFDEK